MSLHTCARCRIHKNVRSRGRFSYFSPKIRTDAIRFALDRGTPDGCEPLVSAVVEQTRTVLQDGGKGRDDYSVLVSIICKEVYLVVSLSLDSRSRPGVTPSFFLFVVTNFG